MGKCGFICLCRGAKGDIGAFSSNISTCDRVCRDLSGLTPPAVTIGTIATGTCCRGFTSSISNPQEQRTAQVGECFTQCECLGTGSQFGSGGVTVPCSIWSPVDVNKLRIRTWIQHGEILENQCGLTAACCALRLTGSGFQQRCNLTTRLACEIGAWVFDNDFPSVLKQLIKPGIYFSNSTECLCQPLTAIALNANIGYTRCLGIDFDTTDSRGAANEACQNLVACCLDTCCKHTSRDLCDILGGTSFDTNCNVRPCNDFFTQCRIAGFEMFIAADKYGSTQSEELIRIEGHFEDDPCGFFEGDVVMNQNGYVQMEICNQYDDQAIDDAGSNLVECPLIVDSTGYARFECGYVHPSGCGLS